MPPAPLVHSEGFKPVYPVPDAQPKLATGAIFNSNRSEAFFGVGRSSVVGDLVSVLLAENTSANRSQNATLKKTAGAKVSSKGLLNIFGDLGPELGSTVTNDGSGQTNQEQTLTGSVTVFIAFIFVYLPVYNLYIGILFTSVCHLRLCCQLFLKPCAVNFLLFCTWIAHLNAR